MDTIDQPPSTASDCPVTARDSSDRKKIAALATSSGSSIEPASGCFLVAYSRMCGSDAARAAIGVAVSDGATRFTRMRSAMYVAAIVVISAVNAPFAAA